MKKLSCQRIEQSPPDWFSYSENKDRSKYFEFNSDEFPSTVYFCSFLNNQVNGDIEILGRIGSPSADAEVYKIRFNNLEFAMKIMPRVNQDSQTKNNKELETAEKASKYPDYFPLSFAKGYHSGSSFYVSENGHKSSFVHHAIEFHSYQRMLNQIDNLQKRKRFEQDYRSGISLNILSSKYNLIYDEDSLIEVDFLISELCNMDLGIWMTTSHDISEWKFVLRNILKGIYYMTEFLEIAHPDLHVGNILINTSVKGEPLALIHDFGRCYSISSEPGNNKMYRGSLYSFCSEFISCTSTRDDLIVPRTVLIIVQDILKFLMKTEFTRDNLQEIYESVLLPIVDDIK